MYIVNNHKVLNITFEKNYAFDYQLLYDPNTYLFWEYFKFILKHEQIKKYRVIYNTRQML